jgi:hypothetical protein
MAGSIFYKPMLATGDFILHIETDNLPSLGGDDNQTETDETAEKSAEEAKSESTKRE